MTPASLPGPLRAAELSAGLTAVRGRIAAACTMAGRAAEEVTLIVVTKTYPASDVLALRSLGVQDVGENRDQEAAVKHASVVAQGVGPEARGHGGDEAPPLRWHLIGQMQTNKSRSVATWADAVHCLDRPRIVDALDRALVEAERTMEALVQVSLDDDPARGGCSIADVDRLADRVAESRALTLKGLMAVAPLGVDPARAFARLAETADQLEPGIRRPDGSLRE